MKAIKQMSLVKQGSKDKGGREVWEEVGGTWDRAGSGRGDREREKGTEEKKGIKEINRGEGEKDVY